MQMQNRGIAASTRLAAARGSVATPRGARHWTEILAAQFLPALPDLPAPLSVIGTVTTVYPLVAPFATWSVSGALGVLGATGRGTEEHYGASGVADVVMCTFSKSFGSLGGFVAGENDVIDYIKHMPWRGPRPYERPYVVVSYQPETIDGADHMDAILASLPQGKLAVFIMPNDDLGSEAIRENIEAYCANHAPDALWFDSLPHAQFLNLLAHCEEFIGNSSSMLYEAPELGIKIRMIGKRQRGRVVPWGDGLASQRIIKILKYSAGTL